MSAPDRAAHNDPENSKGALWRVPAFQTPPKRRPDRAQRVKFWAGGGKKERNFWAVRRREGPAEEGPAEGSRAGYPVEGSEVGGLGEGCLAEGFRRKGGPRKNEK